MHKKWLSIACVILSCLSLTSTGECGKYEDAFKEAFDWQPRINLQCYWERGETEFHTTSRDVPVEVGQSEGHYGTIKHYKKVTELNTEEYMRKWKCRNCGTVIQQFRGVDGYGKPPSSEGRPIVTFAKTDNKESLTIKETGSSHTMVCKKPNLDMYPNINAIWEHAGRPEGRFSYVLDEMWKAARKMDQEEENYLSLPILNIGSKHNPENNEVVSNNKLLSNNIVYTVIEQPEHCCCILQ